MRRACGNGWAKRAAWFTGVAHQRKPLTKWAIVAALVAAWLGFGLVGWLKQGRPVSDAIYETVAALFMAGDYYAVGEKRLMEHEVARFAGIAVTAVGLLFGFSGALGRAVGRLLLMGAKRHVVIAGESDAALALARSCRRFGDAVVLIARDVQPETEWTLRQSGVVLIDGDPAHRDMLRNARAAHAAHLVALSNDAENLQIEAALRGLVEGAGARTAVIADVALKSPTLLLEAREMRLEQSRQTAANGPARIEPRPFSFDELAARMLMRAHATTILAHAERSGQSKPHLVVLGYDSVAEAVAVRGLINLWSVRFGPPSVTIVTPTARTAENRFDGRYPQARAHEPWKADIAFLDFDWADRPLNPEFVQDLASARGPASAFVVATGKDDDNIVLALGLLRACDACAADDLEAQAWRAPIFMYETAESEFSRQFRNGPEPRLTAFGGIEEAASRATIIDRTLDAGAAIAHEMYVRGIAARRAMERKEMLLMSKEWADVPEHFRSANRAVADHAVVKMWDLGWRPAAPHEAGQTIPAPTEMEVGVLAPVEHSRWMAERLLAGWRPAPVRDNRLLRHPNIIAWDALTAEEKARDADQVRAAVMLTALTQPKGFARRT